MHPILARVERIAAYVAAWVVLGALLATVVAQQGQGLPWLDALLFSLPPLIAYAFVCLSAWYVCRAMPLATSRVPSVLAAAGLAAAINGGLWVALNEAWLSLLRSFPDLVASVDRYDELTPLLFTASILLFLLVLSIHYVVLAFDAVRTAERQQLEAQLLTRDAELRALRAQIDPHFLYNSLNSISALTTADPPGARRMCVLLGDFLRNTLKVSELARIAVSDELALADGFLSIEQVRFGQRLRVERAVDETAATCRVPPLLLQPLIENAITHGIAGMLDGGVIRLNIERRDGRLSIVLENPRDPDEPATSRARSGVGLDNVRRRLAATFPGAARMDASASADRFRVEIDLPCVDHD